MKLVYKGHQPVEISNEGVTIFATNNRTVYLDLIRGLQGLNEKVLVVNDNYEPLELQKAIDWDGDLIANDNLYSNYSTEITKSIIKNLTDDERKRIDDVARQLYSTIQEVLFMTDLPLEVQYDGDVKRLINYCRIRFSTLMQQHPYDIIKTDLKLHLECADDSCIGLSNVANYLSPTVFKELLQLDTELKVPLLLVEFTELDNRQYYQNAEFYYIDQDFVDWKL